MYHMDIWFYRTEENVITRIVYKYAYKQVTNKAYENIEFFFKRH